MQPAARPSFQFFARPWRRLRAALVARGRNWVLQRQGRDASSVVLDRRRIYILPTGLGLAFSVMLFAMLLGSLNYSNNLGLALTFTLTALALLAMHECHGNLVGLEVTQAGTEPSFAGQDAGFRVALRNPGRTVRYDLEVSTDHGVAMPVSLVAGGSGSVALRLPTTRRGRIRLARFEVATRYPFGLLRAWAVVHPAVDCLVYPRPASTAPARPPAAVDGVGSREGRGDDDFGGLKDYHPGDPPRHIAWKAFARGGELLVKEFAGAATVTPWFDLAQAPGQHLDERLEVLSRWIVDAEQADLAFGLRLPGIEIEPAAGLAQRERCLAALADFDLPRDAHD